MQHQPSELRRDAAESLERAPGDPRNLALHMLVDESGKMVVQPLLEDGSEHLADHFLERIGLRRRGGNARGDRAELLERAPAGAGNGLVDQWRAEVRPRS